MAFIVSGAHAANSEHSASNYAANPAPSAQLHYQVKAHKYSMTLAGESVVTWQLSNDTSHEKHIQNFVISSETKAALFGKILQVNSQGTIDNLGLAPLQNDEQPANKSKFSTFFNYKKRLISFSENTDTYPINGGEQDRTSAIWQLVAIARAAPDKFINGSSWTMFVAGRHDAENWTFNVTDNVTLSTALGPIACVHIVKMPPPNSKDQQLDIWLAPSMEWYPIRLKFTDANGDSIEQIADKITPLN